MAGGNLSGTELAAMRAELDQVNKQSGYKRHEREPGGPPAANPAEASSPAQPTPEVADPGPPRFLGVDLQNSIAVMSGNAGIPVRPEAHSEIVAILLGELRAHMSRTLAIVSENHGRTTDPAQLEIEFPNGRAD